MASDILETRWPIDRNGFLHSIVRVEGFFFPNLNTINDTISSKQMKWTDCES